MQVDDRAMMIKMLREMVIKCEKRRTNIQTVGIMVCQIGIQELGEDASIRDIAKNFYDRWGYPYWTTIDVMLSVEGGVFSHKDVSLGG